MKRIVMIGTAYETMGGIASVVNVYRDSGLFERYNILYLVSHCDVSFIKKFVKTLFALVRYWGLLFTGQVALLHVHVASRASFWRKSLFLIPTFIVRVPTIFHLHGSEFAIFYEKECGTVRQLAIRSVFNRVNRLVVLSSSWKDWVQGVTTNPKVVAIYNPVIVPTEKTIWGKREGKSVLFLGRLGKRKGIYDLLDAAANLAQRGESVHLRLGGDGELESVQLRALELGLGPQVNLLGWLRGVDKERHLATSYIYALPSYNEGLPMSVLEAMAAGLPILSTPIGGIPEAVSDGVEGFLVQPGDIPALALRLEQLLTEPGLAERMGAAARHKVVTTFSADVIVPKVEALYRELGFAPANIAA